jgi:hypothetical protein
MYLHGVKWGTVGNYSHGRDLKLHPANGASFAIRFRIAIEFQKSNCVDVY